MRMYFKGGSGIENPVDYNGAKIQQGDILTHCWFDGDYVAFFKEHIKIHDLEEIEKRVHAPSVVVKRNDKGIYYGEGIKDTLYMHDFRFKYAKKII